MAILGATTSIVVVSPATLLAVLGTVATLATMLVVGFAGVPVTLWVLAGLRRVRARLDLADPATADPSIEEERPEEPARS